MTKIREKTVQEQYKGWMYFFAFSGLKPPGFAELAKNSYVILLARFINIVNIIICIAYFVSFIYVALFTKLLSTWTLFFLFVRRILASCPMTSKILYNASPIGYNRMNNIYDTWNNVINKGNYVKLRQKIFAERMRQSRSLFYFVLFISGGLLQVPTVVLFFGREGNGAALAYFPHDPYAWHHYWLVALQFVTFLVGGIAGICFNILSYITMLMANTQLEVLHQNLRDIFYDEKLGEKLEDFEIGDGKIQRVRQQLKEWVSDQQATNRWFEDIKLFFKFTSAIKFLFLGSYITLAVFTLPTYVRAGRVVDVIFVLAYTVGNYCLLFFESRLADELFHSSANVFMGAYDTAWYAYPRDICTSLLIIQQCSSQRPFQLKSFAIIRDSSATFLEILKAAYQMLSFLLQMEI